MCELGRLRKQSSEQAFNAERLLLRWFRDTVNLYVRAVVGENLRLKIRIAITAVRGRKISRALSLVALVVLFSLVALADRREVPPDLQIKLAAKVAAYDRNMPKRVSAKAVVLIVQKDTDAQGQRLARRIQASLEKRSKFAGVPSSVEFHTYQGPKPLAALIRNRKIAMAYFAGNFEHDTVAISAALSGLSVLTVTSELAAVRG